MRQGSLILEQAAFVQRKNTDKINTKSGRTQKHHEIHNNRTTTNTLRRRVMKHVPRVNLYSPAFTNPVIVEMFLVQLSQSVKKKNVTHTHRQPDQLIMEPCTHPGMKRHFLPYTPKTASLKEQVTTSNRVFAEDQIMVGFGFGPTGYSLQIIETESRLKQLARTREP